MLKRIFGFVLLVMFVFPSHGSGQAQNNNWSSFRLRKQITPKTRIDIRPIIRFNKNISSYQNTSIDVSINHKLGGGWYVQFLARRWFLPNSTDGQFLWPEIGHQAETKYFAITNRVRLHYSLNLNEINPSDFIRFQSTIVPYVKWKVKPFLALETWYLLDGENVYRRLRIEPGFNIKLDALNNLTVMYRRENTIDVDPSNHQNHYLLTLTRNI